MIGFSKMTLVIDVIISLIQRKILKRKKEEINLSQSGTLAEEVGEFEDGFLYP
jgi:hypothetical protein